MAAREAWLDEGLEVLIEHGAPGLRIDRLAARLGVTKGSFYHHFKSGPAYRQALLDHFETLSTTRHIDAVVATGDDPAANLSRLSDLVTNDPRSRLEVAVRAWAHQDDDARTTQARIDVRRIDFVATLLTRSGYDPERALQLARTMYLVLIGAEQLLPPLPPAELRGLWELVLASSPRPG